MDSLSSVELDRVFIAYKFIQSAKRSGDSFSDQVARGEQTGDYSKARESAAGIILSADSALDKMTSALEAFPGRNKEAAELKATLGSELPRLKEVGDAIETAFDDPGDDPGRDSAGS
jgi:hypothetical protein